MSRLDDLVVELVRKVNELERRQSQASRRGTVHGVRNGGNEVRIKLGEDEDGEPVLTPWLPVSGGNGGTKTRHAYTAGEHVMLSNPSGDWEGAEVRPSNFHQGGQSPSSTEGEHVIHDGGGVRVAVLNGKLTVTAGGVTQTWSSSGVDTTGGKLTHNQRNIGADHKHGGVESGGGETGEPA